MTADPGLRDRLLEADQRYSNRLRFAERPGPLRQAAIVLAHSGDSWFIAPPLLLVWLLAGPPWKALAGQLLLGIAITAVVVFAIKRLVRRERPEGDWGSIYRNTDPHSFPSGHAARMAMLLVLGSLIGPWSGVPWLAWILLPWAPLVALARVGMGVHYLSDVVGGALIGVVIGALLAVVISIA